MFALDYIGEHCIFFQKFATVCALLFCLFSLPLGSGLCVLEIIFMYVPLLLEPKYRSAVFYK